VQFDLQATGQKGATGWVGGGDGLLVLDRNGDGVINDGSELFGSGTTLATGQKAATGYQAMDELDTNRDGVIDSADQAYGKLQVWIDGNADGLSQADELKSLGDLGITKLNLDAKQNASLNNGNIVGITSTYETSDGNTHQAADVWFQMAAPGASLTTSVSSLTQALSGYTAAAAAAGTAKLEVPGSVGNNAAALASAIGQYSAAQLGAASTAVATEDALRLKALQSTASHGILAVK